MKKKRSPRSSFNFYWLEAAVICILAIAVLTIARNGGPQQKPARQGIISTQKKAAPAEKPRAPEVRKAPAPAPATSPLSLSPGEYEVMHVFDGDTLDLKDSRNNRIRVRLYGIDAPEGRQAYGRESRASASQMLRGRKVRIKKMYVDDYQRVVAIVYLSSGGTTDALSVNERQIQSGMAWVYDFFCKSEECNTWKFEEGLAKHRKIGIWSSPSSMPPWQWRAMQKQ